MNEWWKWWWEENGKETTNESLIQKKDRLGETCNCFYNNIKGTLQIDFRKRSKEKGEVGMYKAKMVVRRNIENNKYYSK